MTGRVMTGTMLEGNCRYGNSSFPWPQHTIWHYSVQTIIWLQLCQTVCAITVRVTVQILLCGYKNSNWKITKFTFLEVSWKLY